MKKNSKSTSKPGNSRTNYEHGELLTSIILKAIYVKEKESFLMSDCTKLFQGKNLPNLEPGKTVELQNVIVEKRTNFCYDYAIISTKQTKVSKARKNIKKQFKPSYEKFSNVKEGRMTNVQALITKKNDLELQLFDGSFFKIRLKDPMTFTSDKLNLLFVKKSTGYNYVWPTNLTTIFEADENDSSWSDVTLPEIKLHENPENIPINYIGKWCGMLTTVSPPFTYGKPNSDLF